MKGLCCNNERILDCRDGVVRFRYKDYAHGTGSKEKTLRTCSSLAQRRN